MVFFWQDENAPTEQEQEVLHEDPTHELEVLVVGNSGNSYPLSWVG